PIPVYLLGINLTTYVAFWADKERARQRLYRISESNLLLLAILGGSPAAIIAQQYLRHKTRKQPFCTILLCIPGIQTGVAVWLALSI
ncbi:MAG TPA: DUF1294 domain-containing protein, partial [Candidatus Koribacter sp.]